MRAHPYVLLDVFTDRPLAGNQLAIFTDTRELPESLFQPLARELNLSETVFMLPPERGGDARMRIFSSVTELAFAGHPTLGAGCFLAADRATGGEPVRVMLETAKGTVPVEVRWDEGGGLSGWMSQPVPTVTDWTLTTELCAVLGVPAPVLPVEVYDNGIKHLFVVLAEVGQVEAIVPDFAALGRLCGEEVRINVAAGSGTSYTARMFSPFDYVPEDPACGSAAGPLGVHLLRYDMLRPGETLTIAQGAQVGRPSTLYARITGTSGAIDEVRVGGGVRIIATGAFEL